MLHEESVAVPFILSMPGMKGRVDGRQLVSGLDIFPTVCGLAGVKAPEGLEGKDLSPLLSGKEVAPRGQVVTALYDVRWGDKPGPSGEGRMLRTDRYRYALYAWGKDREALFDLENDPGETRNLAPDPAARVVLQEHRERLRLWVMENGDSLAEALFAGL
jgi:arylsulfatase A-like enzyme